MYIPADRKNTKTFEGYTLVLVRNLRYLLRMKLWTEIYVVSEFTLQSASKNVYISLFQPAVSVGNVGQLAADLLISTMWLDRCGFIYHDSILPLVGNDPYAHPEADVCKVVTACEGTHTKFYALYEKRELHCFLLSVIQSVLTRRWSWCMCVRGGG